MIDVVHVAASFVQLDEVADDRDEIFLRENRLARGTVRVQALIDLVTADAAEVVALRREEQPVERIARRLAVRRVAGPEQRVDLLQSEPSLRRVTVRRRCILSTSVGSLRIVLRISIDSARPDGTNT